ncbi:hypothetical protein FI667_g1628, partial [Globisporangium splendens]
MGGDVNAVDVAPSSPSKKIDSVQPLKLTPNEVPSFEPLRAQWRYEQAVFARYRRTPYFCSGSIATYLGAGLFMVVFDDGMLNYRVKREDIVLREFASSLGSQDNDESSVPPRDHSSSSSNGDQSLSSIGKPKSSPLKHANQHWHSNSSIIHQNHMMVDFSMNPPKQITFNGGGGDAITDEALSMKRLECGVGYEDDSTQVSDSDESSEGDMSMTPWQQMTQTFGMGKTHPRASRRSNPAVAEKYQTDDRRLSVPENEKVQPSSVGTDVVLLEHLRLMEIQLRNLIERYEKEPTFSTRVLYEKPADGLRGYGTIKSRLESGDCEVVTEDDQMITVKVFAPSKVDFLPSVKELARQMSDLLRKSKKLYAGRKVQVNLHPGNRFSGNGVVTLEIENEAMFNVLLQNRIRLMNVPADKLVPLREKKKDVVTITEDQFLACSNKTKVYIGDQIFVECEGDYEGIIEEKIGILNGVFSNKPAAVDFADGSAGYEVPPGLISKRKRAQVSADMDVLSLKNAVLMQASGTGSDLLEVGYQVKADHPRRASVETCVVIKEHDSSACDLRFGDGTIAFEVFPSQMMLDKVIPSTMGKTQVLREASVGDCVLGWSSRFGRYCSAKVSAKALEGVSALYTLVFDYGEQKNNVPLEKLAPIDLPDALSPTQKLTNYSIDTTGFEIWPVSFTVGEAVMARVHGSVQYYNGWVEGVREKERMCVVQFDSSERDEHVPFSAMLSADPRNRFQSVSNSMGSSSGGADRLSHFQEESAVAGTADDEKSRRRRHSGGSVGSIIMSVAGSIFRPKKDVDPLERRGSRLVTEMGAKVQRVRED